MDQLYEKESSYEPFAGVQTLQTAHFWLSCSLGVQVRVRQAEPSG